MAECTAGNPTTYLVLTKRVNWTIGPAEAAKILAHSWRLVRLRIIRRWRLKHLPFIAVFEKTRVGWPHLNILMRAPYIDQKWLSDQMRELCDGENVDIRWIDNPGRVSGYVTKYVAKETEKFGTCKRYWQSQDYDQRPKYENKDKIAPGHGWERLRNTVKHVAKGWEELEWKVRWTSTRTVECTIPP